MPLGAVDSQDLPGLKLGRFALQGVRGKIQQSGIQGHCTLAHEPRDLRVPAGQVKLKLAPWDVPLGPSLRPCRKTLWVEVWVEGAFVRTVPVNLLFEMSAPLKSEEEADVPLESPPEADPVEKPAAFPQPVKPSVAKDRILPVPPVLKCGQMASLRSSTGAIRMESRVQVLQDGAPGEVIRVKLPSASSSFRARVIGPDLLEALP
ncbi:flagella basal body P-ring formation protein FlgA [Holophaga foetida]|uniref:flagella basal body P-ring formation protein FlgA n=1 Tax=Holophaga foetida TaxID=35839 RepID=UPI0002474647|nr:flagella basal body P-ring formation protein FlgA [Holophaga foetida]